LDIAALESTHQNLEYVSSSFLDIDITKASMKGVDVLYHLAATKFPQNANAEPIQDISENIIGSAGLFKVAVDHGVSRTIF
jgi:nucleoside-diphosphate-sugar epimerase